MEHLERNTAGIQMIPESGETERLILKDSVMEECNQLQKLNEASDYIAKWVGWKTPPDYAYKTLTEGNLPPGGVKEHFKVKSICLKADSELIGLVELYHGYPSDDSLCIGWLFIHPEHQGKRYARETVNYLSEEAYKAGYDRIRLGVHLKNWPALRFWTSMGFDRIIGFIGDHVHTENADASVILMKGLK